MSSTEPHSISNRYRQRRGKVEKRQKADKKQQFEVAVEQQENAADAETVLRQFDLATKYGPCVGMTRQDRWARAHKLGLEPPQEVRELLLQMKEHDEANNCLWHGRV